MPRTVLTTIHAEVVERQAVPASVLPVPGAVVSGRVRRLVDHLEQHHSPFLVSRLILTTGVRVREFTAETPDDPTVIAKLFRALHSILPDAEAKQIEAAVSGDAASPSK